MKELSHDEVERRINYLGRGVEQLIDRDELAWKIQKANREDRSLRVKLGVDPTAPDLHLGHTVPLMKLRHFQDLGYNVDFLIGDFTARIGDPSGRSTGRKAMTQEEVDANAEQYKRQIFRILDPDRTKIVYNSDWLDPIKLSDFIRVLGVGSVNEMVKRRSVSNRLESGGNVSVAEFIYPFLQAYDSVAMRSDVEIGGTDQYFNFVFAREMQRAYGQEPEVVMTLPLLIGLDGKDKMSKTYNNHVALEASPSEMYGRIMSMPDELLITYFDLLTPVDFEEVTELEVGLVKGTLHARDVKARLAREIVTLYHSKADATKAEQGFDRVHRMRKAPESIQEAMLPDYEARSVKGLLVELGMASSSSNAKRVITQGGVRIDGQTIEDPNQNITPYEGMVVNVGKMNFRKIAYQPKNE